MKSRCQSWVGSSTKRAPLHQSCETNFSHSNNNKTVFAFTRDSVVVLFWVVIVQQSKTRPVTNSKSLIMSLWQLALVKNHQPNGTSLATGSTTSLIARREILLWLERATAV